MTTIHMRHKSSSTRTLSVLPLGATQLKGKWTWELGRTNTSKDEKI